jgi:hypothetical protein
MGHELGPEADAEHGATGVEQAPEQIDLGGQKRPSRVPEISDPHRTSKNDESVFIGNVRRNRGPIE